MKVSPKPLIVLLIAFFSGNAMACSPPPPSKAFAREGRNVIIGKVNGRGFVQPREAGMPEMLISVERVELLSGKAPSVVTAVVPCAFPLALGARVVVVTFDHRRYVYPAEMYEESFRSVHDSKR
ncbi:MAG: hypothetical protein EON58_18210 [Alphaproteobacteria bacterium]|nr:MAG: hypothetical protein EON58_18210 [Alphaproteobacteria bacterium]